MFRSPFVPQVLLFVLAIYQFLVCMHRLGFLSLLNPYLSLYFQYLAARKGEKTISSDHCVFAGSTTLSYFISRCGFIFSISATYDFSCSNPEISTAQTIPTVFKSLLGKTVGILLPPYLCLH